MTMTLVHLNFYKVGALRPGLVLEARWWDTDELCKDPRFIQSNDTGSYYDWDAELSVPDFQILHERYRVQMQTGLFAGDDWQKVIQPKMQMIEAALAGGLGTLSHIHVNVFET